MDRIANLDERSRMELFSQTAANRGFHPAIAEKDFWVCWVLMKLFESSDLANQLVFKGGTSLSKVHRLIDRFSEDIDLVLNWELLGYGKHGDDPGQSHPTKTQLDKFNARFNEKAAAYINDVLLGTINQLIRTCASVRASVLPSDPLVIVIQYPASFDLSAIRPEVKLEIGPLASWVPSAKHTVRPYAAEEFPKLFDKPDCEVVAISAERTFWEKATILHQQAHRTTIMPAGYSRHYYDLAMLANSPVRATALADLQLLRDVVEFKERFYRSPWARYDLAKPGTFRLIPTPDREKELVQDYRDMRPMFFKRPPDWLTVIEGLMRLEAEINVLST